MFETLIPATNNDDCVKLVFPGNQHENQSQNNASQEDTDRISEVFQNNASQEDTDRISEVFQNNASQEDTDRISEVFQNNASQEDTDRISEVFQNNASQEDTDRISEIQSDIHDKLKNDQNATVGVNQENSIVLRRTTSKSNDNQEDNSIPGKMDESIKVAIIAALVAFAGIIAAALFAALCTLENQHVGSKKLILKFQDILHPKKWPSHFLLIVLLTIGFTVSLVVAVVSIWRMIMEWSFCYRALVFVAVCAFFAGYGFMLKEKVPNFTFGNIPGYWVVWLLGCSLVLLAIATLAVILEIARRIRTSISSLGVKFGLIQIQLD